MIITLLSVVIGRWLPTRFVGKAAVAGFGKEARYGLRRKKLNNSLFH
ncbi:MAG: hypothetical protein IKX33_09285 [Prevotella sp.]|nr:hypothetical protein [Prevotella sp.]